MRSDLLIVNRSLQLYIERSVIGLDPGGDWNMSFVIGDPQREPSFFVFDETVRPEQVRLNSKSSDSSKNSLHLLPLDNLNWYAVDLTAIANKNFEGFA